MSHSTTGWCTRTSCESVLTIASGSSRRGVNWQGRHLASALSFEDQRRYSRYGTQSRKPCELRLAPTRVSSQLKSVRVRQAAHRYEVYDDRGSIFD